jgi:hypothetical protein
MESITGIWAGFVAVLTALIVWLAKAYLVPFLATGRAKNYAEWIAKIADEVTDDLVKKYPGSRIASFANDAVDEVMKICDIQKTTAQRAVNAALQRKKTPLPEEAKAS